MIHFIGTLIYASKRGTFSTLVWIWDEKLLQAPKRNKHRHLVLLVALSSAPVRACDRNALIEPAVPLPYLVHCQTNRCTRAKQKFSRQTRIMEHRRSMAFWDNSQKCLFPPCKSALTTCDTWLVFNRKAQNQVRLRFPIRWQVSTQYRTLLTGSEASVSFK